MSVFFTHRLPPDSSPRSLLALALPAAGTLPEEAVELTSMPGPLLAGRQATWWLWELAPGTPALIVPSILDEDDPDDAPYPCHEGLIARVDGTRSAFVGLAHPEGRHPLVGVLKVMVETAQSRAADWWEVERVGE